ncbi:hypothetical protein ACFY8P_06300 [Streptomyces sp. NPDC012693]|uniref:hypothetical protein n=1 Tax=Streptomyces sp. NPDC012693 TaxID=3364844 RepID=UPI0036CA27B6
MRFKPGLFHSRPRSSSPLTTRVTTAVTSVAALAVLGGLAVPPALAAQNAARSTAPNLAPTADSYDGYDAKAAQQLREDQCMATEGLRMGGPHLQALAQNALVLPPDQLHAQLKRDMMDDKTPLHAAWNQDRAHGPVARQGPEAGLRLVRRHQRPGVVPQRAEGSGQDLRPDRAAPVAVPGVLGSAQPLQSLLRLVAHRRRQDEGRRARDR